LLKLGKYFILVPYSVVSGFMTGIGVIIIVLQLGPILGHSGTPSLLTTLDYFPEWLAVISWHDLTLGLLAIAGVCFWPHRWNVWLPSPLLVLLLGTLCVLWLPEGAVATIGAIPSAFPSLQWPMFSLDMLDDLLYAAVLLAVLGSIDSLLTSLVADNLTKQQHDSDRELIGQGIGNTVAGFFVRGPYTPGCAGGYPDQGGYRYHRLALSATPWPAASGYCGTDGAGVISDGFCRFDYRRVGGSIFIQHDYRRAFDDDSVG
jgi:MFS superfamily sulfate permease-like transporter